MSATAHESRRDTYNYTAIAEQLAASYPSMSALDDISLGWIDALLFDSAFFSAKLKNRAPKSAPPSAQAQPGTAALGESSAEQLLQKICEQPSVQCIEQAARALNTAPEALLRRDDYWDIPPEQLHDKLRRSFQPERFNLVIVGAGPVGALLASGLKRALGDRVDVLLLESRVEAAHHKRAYSRHWQMNIPHALVGKLLLPAASSICAALGDGRYVGVDMCTLETLALLSARASGVRCLFSDTPPEAWLEGAAVHLLVDASGGRWLSPEATPAKTIPNLRLQVGNRANAYLPFGLVRATSIPNNTIDVQSKNGYLSPLFKGRAIKQSLIKLSDLPMELYPVLLPWVQANNRDSKFYLWPGRKHGTINRLLLLVNMSPKEHEALSKFMQTETRLELVYKWCLDQTSIDPRLRELLRTVYAHGDCKQTVSVSRPFLVQPRMLDPDGHSRSLLNIPLLCVGDSFFSGNPKSGNGLGVHLQHIHAVGVQLKTALDAF